MTAAEIQKAINKLKEKKIKFEKVLKQFDYSFDVPNGNLENIQTFLNNNTEKIREITTSPGFEYLRNFSLKMNPLLTKSSLIMEYTKAAKSNLSEYRSTLINSYNKLIIDIEDLETQKRQCV